MLELRCWHNRGSHNKYASSNQIVYRTICRTIRDPSYHTCLETWLCFCCKDLAILAPAALDPALLLQSICACAIHPRISSAWHVPIQDLERVIRPFSCSGFSLSHAKNLYSTIIIN